MSGFAKKAVHQFYDNLQEAYGLPEKEGQVKNLLKIVQEKVIEVLENENAELHPLLKYQAIQDAEGEAQRIVQEANEKYRNVEEESVRMIAKADAEAIAGKALDAKENADAYKKTAKAKTYGDIQIFLWGNSKILCKPISI